MRRPTESALVTIDGVVESPERWASFDETRELSMHELRQRRIARMDIEEPSVPPRGVQQRT